MSLHREWNNLPGHKFWRQELLGGGMLEIRRLPDDKLEVSIAHGEVLSDEVVTSGSLSESSAKSLLEWLDRSSS